MRTLFLLIALSFHIALSFSSKESTVAAVKLIVKDLQKLSPVLRSSLHSRHSVIVTCDCDLHAVKYLIQMLDQVNPKNVSPSDKDQLGRITKNLDKVHHEKKKEEEKNCLKFRRLRKRTTSVVPHSDNLQHWLRECIKP